MSHTVSFGSQHLELNDPDDRIARPLSPLAAALDDPIGTARGALAQPVGLPPLTQLTVDGDRVAIAVGDSSPLVPELVAVVVESLLTGPVEADGIVVVVPAGEYGLVDAIREAVNAMLPEALRGTIGVLAHTPADKESLAYLAASNDALPIYLNRLIAEADFVVPIGTARPDSTFGYHGVPGALYPAFSDLETISRFTAPTSTDWPAQRRRRREAADEVSYLAGIMFTVQVVPAANGGAIDVMAGLADEIKNAAQAKADSAWNIDTPGAADLVIAAIDGSASEQTWDNFARALFTARSLAAPNAAIVICSEIDRRPGDAIRSLAAFDSYDDLQRHLLQEKGEGAATAAMLAHTLEHANVFLMSQLNDTVVEEIGLAPLHDASELQRLVDRHQSVLLLASAQHVAIRPIEPAEIVLSRE